MFMHKILNLQTFLVFSLGYYHKNATCSRGMLSQSLTLGFLKKQLIETAKRYV